MSLVQREGKDTQILIRSVEFFTRFMICDLRFTTKESA